ncbi:hypothetical protein [Spirosoma pollinicola]|uniref:Uncharacterized protein n=1 Tax=Spirosoma pollinicola TaxID=2057025 RepID=A0A2K8YZJ1_9BACT|nr:hypothetical protein [Spirosoma pollinicola]AUD02994.1 hypothetical protein CWM47_14815 [Spirosoma pollinicola]
MKRVLSIGLLAVAVLSLASCDYQKYNSVRQNDYRVDDYRADYRAGDPEVYGTGRDSSAVQTKYKYTPNPDLDARTQKIREKLFGAGTLGQGA